MSLMLQSLRSSRGRAHKCSMVSSHVPRGRYALIFLKAAAHLFHLEKTSANHAALGGWLVLLFWKLNIYYIFLALQPYNQGKETKPYIYVFPAILTFLFLTLCIADQTRGRWFPSLRTLESHERNRANACSLRSCFPPRGARTSKELFLSSETALHL